MADRPLVEIQDLGKHFDLRRGLARLLSGAEDNVVKAVDGFSLDIWRGETVGLIGESGCGKSTLGRTILRLQEPTSGRVLFDGNDMTGLDDHALKGLRRRMEFNGPKGNLWVRLATAKVFLSDKPGVWSTDTQLSIIAPTAQFRRIGGMSELIVPVKFDGSGKATIEIEWHWQ